MPGPYEITSDEDGYKFTTDQGIEYRIVFEDLNSIFYEYPTLHGRVFSYAFFPTQKLSREGRRKDLRIKITIAHSIQEFFETRDNLIVFVCDSTDNRDLCRKRLFDLWFEELNPGSLEKYDGYVGKDDYYIINAIIIRVDLQDKNYVIQTFESLNDQLTQAK